MGLKSWARNEWSEAKEAGREIVSFVRHHDWKKSARQSVKRKYWVWWLCAIVITVAVVLLSIYRDTIIEKFEPHKQDIIDLPVSWLIPVAILIVISFPPLGGQELIIMVVGLIWGVWWGFAIVTAGTFIGEVLCFWGFKYLFTRKAAEIEQKSIFYACIARLMRDGGIWIIIVVRFSAVPGHVVTAIQSTVGMPLWIYSIAILVSMPKQLAIVYLGYMFGVNHETATPSQVRQQKIISLSVLFATGIATVLALYITYMRARRLYPEVLRDMEEAKVAQSPLADGSAPPGLARRRSLVEAAFEGEPGVAEVEGRGYGYRRGAAPGGGRGSAHGMGRTRAGARWGAEGGAEADDYEGDDWDAKSPAMRGQRPHGDMRDKLAWQDGRAYVEQAPTLRYGGGGARADDEDDGGDPASSYAHLPLASESEVGAYGQAHGAGTGAGVGGPARGPYEDPFEAPTEGGNMAGVGVGSKGGRYGALGRSR